MKRIEFYSLSEVVEVAPYDSFTFSTWANGYVASPFTTAEKSVLDDLFKNYILPRFYDYSCVREEYEFYEISVGISSESKKKLIYKFYSIFQSTYDRYKNLIAYYTDYIGHLMDKIKSTGMSRFNDTPQDSGEFSDDSHTTHLTQTEQATELNTPIERLDEIRKKLANIMKEWSDEFSGLFYEVSL